MLWKILHLLEGEVRIRVETEYPERVLNLCGEWRIAFWDVCWCSPSSFTCRLSRGDLRRLRHVCRSLDCTLQLESSRGVPFLAGRFLHRPVLLACLVGSMMALFLSSFLIFDFSVTGNETVPTEEILRALERNGLSMGTFAPSIDAESLRNHILLELPELSWITVNVSGCRACVDVRERIQREETVSRREPANLVARRDGLVLTVRPLSGTRCVLPGTAVEEGQLLISGVEDTENSGARMVAGLGSVTARTWYELTVRMPLVVEEKVLTERKETCFSLVLGRHRIKIFGNSGDIGADCDTIYRRTQWSVLDIPLPVTGVQEIRQYFERRTVQRSPETVEAGAETILTGYLHAQVDPYGTVSSTLCTSKVDGDTLVVTLRAECEEEIARTVPVYRQEPPA